MGSPSLRRYAWISFLLIGINGLSTSAESCNIGCPPSSKGGGLLKYAPGTAYNYDFDSVVTVELAGTDSQETNVHIQGQATIFVEQNCRLALQLRSLTVLGPDRKRNRITENINKLVRFTLAQNDEILPEICADETDSDYLLNIKRGLISLIQSASSKSSETDVFGTCPTIFSNTESGDQIIVSKVRNLNSCGYREQLSNGLITGIIDESAGIKSTPLLNGDYSSEQRIKGGIITSVQLNEEYHYVPLTAGEAGPRAKVVTKLTFKEKTSGTVPSQSSPVPRSIIFENPVAPTIRNTEKIRDGIKNVIETYRTNVGPAAATQFTELIRLLRFTDKNTLLQVYQNVKSGTINENKSLVRKIYFDSLFRVGNGESVSVLAQLIKSRELNEQEQRQAYLSFNLVQSMTKDALASLNKLLEGNTNKEAYLSAGNLVNKYCRRHGCESSDVKGILEKFVKLLNNCKADNRQQEDVVLAVLKGIRNTNHLVAPALDKVIQCTGGKFKDRIRVAAIQALAAGSCNKKVQNQALGLLKDVNEDSEIRIESYLVLVACPSGQVANDIKSILDEEKVYQVGSFIQSHLANIRSSTDPDRQSARHHFTHLRSSNKFPFDFRRYSFNQEYSYAIGSLGLGASADTNVIFSQKSFLPRSTKLNVTGEIFGSNFNIFELAGRQENLDVLLERNFGPKGVFNTNSIQEFLQSLIDNFLNKNRPKRSVRDDIKQFSNSVDLGVEGNRDIDIDLSLKLFGSELYFLSLGNDLPLEPSDFIQKITSFVERTLTNAKGYEKTFEHHSLFLDAELVYPTGAGVPLKLSTQGAGVARIEASGNNDIKSIVNNPNDAKINFRIVPSYNIEVTGTLSVDGLVVTAGLQVAANLHSATGVTVDLALLPGGKGFDLKLQTSKKEQEIVTFDHKVVFITQERGQVSVATALKFSSKKQEYSGCFDQLSSVIGVTFCGGVVATLPGSPGVAPFPLNGINKAYLRLETVESYTFHLSIDDKNPRHQTVLAVFDTSKGQRTSLKLEAATEPSIFIRATLESPIRNVLLEAGLTNSPNELIGYAKGTSGPDQYLLKVGYSKAGTAQRREYTPIIIYQRPGHNEDSIFGYKVTGKIIEEPSGPKTRYTFERIQLVANNHPDPFQLNGWIDWSAGRFDGDVNLVQSYRKGQAKGFFQFEKNFVNLDVSVTSNFHDLANGRVALEVDVRNENKFRNNVIFVYGPDLESSTKRFEALTEYEYTKNGNVAALKFNSKINAPTVPIKSEISGEYDKNLIKYDAEISYNKFKIGSDLTVKLNTRQFGEYDVTFGALYNAHTLKLISKREIENEKSKLVNKLTTSVGLQADLNGFVSRKSTKEGEVNLNGALQLSDKQTPYKFIFGLITTGSDSKSNFKLTQSNVELVTYDFKLLIAGDKKTGTLTGNVKDVLSGDGTFESTKGVGTSDFIIDFKQFARKLKTETKFKIDKPNYEIKNDFYYDFGNDKGKVITFETKNHVTENDLNSNNNLIIFSERYDFTVSLSKTGSEPDNGKIQGKFELKLPSQQRINGELNRDARLKSTPATADVLYLLTLTQPDQKTASVKFTGKLTDGDFVKKYFTANHEFTYKSLDDRKVSVQLATKHGDSKTGEYRSGLVDLTVKSDYIPDPFRLTVTVDEYCSKHAVYNIKSNYGQRYEFTESGNYRLGGRGKPTTYETVADLKIPNTDFSSVTFRSNGKFLRPEVENGFYETDITGALQLKDSLFSVTTTVKGNSHTGNGNLKIIVPKSDPITVDGSYTHDTDNEKVANTGTVRIVYGPGKVIQFNGDLTTVDGKEIALHSVVKTPFSNAENIEFSIKSSRPVEDTYANSITIKQNKDQYSFQSTAVLSNTNPSIDLILSFADKYPTWKLSTGYKRLSDRKYSGQLTAENIFGFDIRSTGEVSIQSPDNFYIRGTVDSTRLKLNQIQIDIKSKPGSGGRGVDFKILTAEKNILSGSADYAIREEKSKTVIEGKGNVKVYDSENKAASFNLVRTRYDDTETGYLVVFNGFLGPKNIVAEVKLTNRNFHIKNTICEEKTQCINFEVKSAIKDDGKSNFKHELLVSVDLRKFGYQHEFGLKSETNRNGYEFSHIFDTHLQSADKSKYQYSVHVNGKGAGITVILPKRTLGVETVYTVPSGGLFGRYELSLASYLDKEHNPNDITKIGFTGDLTRKRDKVITGEAELTFSHPLLRKYSVKGQTELNGETLTATSTLKIDLFRQPSQAITVTSKTSQQIGFKGPGFNVSSEVTVNGPAFGLNYRANGHAGISIDRKELSVSGSVELPNGPNQEISLLAFIGPEQFELLATGFNEELIHIDGSYDLRKKQGLFSSKSRLFGATPFIIDAKSDGLQSLKFSLSRQGLVEVSGEVTTGKEISLKTTSNGKDLFTGRIALDQAHFLASDYHVDDTAINGFLDQVRTEISSDWKRSSGKLTERLTDLKNYVSGKSEQVKQALPEFYKLKNSYATELKQLVDELKSDESIKQFLDLFTKINETIRKTVTDVWEILSKYYRTVHEILSEAYRSYVDAVKKRIVPILESSGQELTRIIGNLYKTSWDILSSIINRTFKVLKQFEPDFIKIGKAVSKIGQEVAGYLTKYFDILNKELSDFYHLAVEHIKSSQGIELVKEKFNDILSKLAIKDTVISVFHELTRTLREAMPTEEIKKFLDVVSSYIVKKLNNEPINDFDALKEIYVSGLRAIRSLWDQFKQYNVPKTGEKSWIPTFFAPIPYSLETLKRIPYAYTIKSSIWNYLRNEPLISLSDLIRTYRPYAFNPLNFLPPYELHAQIADGQHIFTFNGGHLTFPGTCQYIFAADFVNGNFTIIGNLKDGKLVSISLLDRSDSIELQSDGKVSLNGKPVDFPIHKSDINAWRNYHFITLFTEYGAKIICSLDLRLCQVTVNGFYHGKIRGLLGPGNGEPNFDYVLPTNKLAENFADFGNGYKLVKSCGAVPFVDHHSHTGSELCGKFFSYDSPLSLGYLFIDPAKYREACEHAVSTSTDKLDAACNIANIYVAASRKEHILVSTPSECAQCPTKHEIGDAYSIASPQKKADIVLVVDTELGPTVLNELIQPLIQELRRELRVREITDTHIVIIGYNEKKRYSALLTAGGKLDFTGKLATVRFADLPDEPTPLVTGERRLDQWILDSAERIKKIKEELGLSKDAMAFRQAITYPFRVDASRAIIAFRSNRLLYSANVAKHLQGTALSGYAKLNGITLHSVTPIEGLNIKNRDEKFTQTIVGFNAQHVLQLSDARKRANIGSTDLRTNLEYESDLGIDLVQAGTGYSFNLQTFIQRTAKPDRKQYLQVLANVLGDQIARTEVLSDCRCGLLDGLYGIDRCVAKETKLLPPIKRAGARG